jgi:L-alanine-DL-glutamate epimerase-like enolase superfamily enzyme
MHEMVSMMRRNILKSAAAAPLAAMTGCGLGIFKPKYNRTDIRVEDVNFSYEEYRYRAPYKFGGRAVDRATLLNVVTRVRTLDGREASGFGSIPLGNVWSFPSKTMSYDTTLGAMKSLAAEIARIVKEYKSPGHPIELGTQMERSFLEAAKDVSARLALAEAIPKLCTLVTASPFDAAIHDAFGKVHGVSCYQTYGREFVKKDLSAFLGHDFSGEYLDRYVRQNPQPRIPIFHSVGAGDPITAQDVRQPLDDGYPETLPEWIEYNGIRRIKIKLNGQDLEGDLERVVLIDRTAEEAQKRLRVGEWFYCLDFNENCPNVEFVLEFLRRLKERAPAGFERILYIEQPTARDLKANRANVMHEAAKLRPIVIDESLTDMETLLLAREMGYTGIALKACKGQTQAMLMAAAGQKYGMFLCVQDLTCPGASFIHSAGIAAHVPGMAGVEANARQYMPEANKLWAQKFPGIFNVKEGTIETGMLTGRGLGAVDA